MTFYITYLCCDVMVRPYCKHPDGCGRVIEELIVNRHLIVYSASCVYTTPTSQGRCVRLESELHTLAQTNSVLLLLTIILVIIIIIIVY